MKIRRYPLVLLLLALLSGCREELPVLDSEQEIITYPTDPKDIEGFFSSQRRKHGKQQMYN